MLSEGEHTEKTAERDGMSVCGNFHSLAVRKVRGKWLRSKCSSGHSPNYDEPRLALGVAPASYSVVVFP